MHFPTSGLLLSTLTLSLAQDFASITPPKGTKLDQIPQLGFGTWNIQLTGNVTESVANAIELGYRHIDGAWVYFNQQNVGSGIKEGLRRTGLQRSDLWVTSKVWNTRHGQENAALSQTLDELDLDYLDLYLIHWPVGNTTGRNSFDHVQTWKNMEKLVRPARGTRFIGVSNFSPKQVDDILKVATIKPKTHQFELHPYLQQSEFVEYNLKNNITVVAYSPLANTNPSYLALSNRQAKLLSNPVITDVARARGCTPAQVSLAWNMKRKVVVIPKSSSPEHRKENIEALDKCKVTDEDMQKIGKIGITLRLSSSVCTAGGGDVRASECFQGLAGM